MRPFGHTDPRAERDHALVTFDQRIVEAWYDYAAKEFVYYTDIDAYPHRDYPKYYAHALERLEPLRPSSEELQRFIHHQHELINSACEGRELSERGELLGMFLSAGYRAAPEPVIEHRVVTPGIHGIGYELEKDLVITGAVGHNAGRFMAGTLTNYGRTGDGAGSRLLGTLINHGVMGGRAGAFMVGRVENHGEMGPRAGMWMIGTFTNRGSIDVYDDGHQYHPLFDDIEIGMSDDHGRINWRHCDDHAGFLRALENPDRLSSAELSRQLQERYWRRSE